MKNYKILLRDCPKEKVDGIIAEIVKDDFFKQHPLERTRNRKKADEIVCFTEEAYEEELSKNRSGYITISLYSLEDYRIIRTGN